MKIHSLADTGQDPVYFEHDFKVVLESHLTYLKISNPKAVNVSKQQNYKYEGDLYGLLDELNINKEYHYIVMRINDYVNSAHFKGDKEFLILPDFAEVEILKGVYQTKNEA